MQYLLLLHVDEPAIFRDGGVIASIELRYEGFVVGSGFEAKDFGFGVEPGF